MSEQSCYQLAAYRGTRCGRLIKNDQVFAWTDRVQDAETILAELRSLEAERDSLKKRVEELEGFASNLCMEEQFNPEERREWQWLQPGEAIYSGPFPPPSVKGEGQG